MESTDTTSRHPSTQFEINIVLQIFLGNGEQQIFERSLNHYQLHWRARSPPIILYHWMKVLEGQQRDQLAQRMFIDGILERMNVAHIRLGGLWFTLDRTAAIKMFSQFYAFTDQKYLVLHGWDHASLQNHHKVTCCKTAERPRCDRRTSKEWVKEMGRGMSMSINSTTYTHLHYAAHLEIPLAAIAAGM